jgi:hypothetical protein
VSLQTLRLWICSLACLGIVFSAYPVAARETSTAAGQVSENQGVPSKTTLSPNSDTDGAIGPANNDYLSPITKADTSFTHILLRWQASGPAATLLQIEIRASNDAKTWSDWGKVTTDPDLWQDSDGPNVFWSEIIYAGDDSRFWQLRSFAQADANGVLPVVSSIDVNVVDARWGRESEQQALLTSQPEIASAINKPAVLSRSTWGSPDGQGSRVKTVYYPVKHMVVHHTADPNTLRGGETSWGDRVRAIWSFHTISRGWGDVGYNYLIDPNGVIYEGRAGGDDGVAFHDTSNYGSMGVSVLGTYGGTTPTAASQNSLVELLAWKAQQKKIDPLGRSFYYGCSISKYCKPFNSGSVVDNIAGHRQVTPGHTTCPGDAFMSIMPSIRNRVAERLAGGSGGVPEPTDNGDLLIDELETTFSRSDANWRDAYCGYGGHAYFTYATDKVAESTNTATWKPNIPTAGRYTLYAHIPQGCGLASPPYATTSATYTIHSADGTTSRTIDQNRSDDWVDLGTYSFSAGKNGFVTLSDLTGEPFSQRKVVFFDSIKWVPVSEYDADVQLVKVSYPRTTISAGELLKVHFTVKNVGATSIAGQEPQAGTNGDGSYNSNNGYVYDENECFLSDSAGNYPAYPKETGRFRVALGAQGFSQTCAGDAGGYPWRWGIDGELLPGQTREITGYIRFRTPGSYTIQAGLVQEYVKYHTQGVETKTITVTPEQFAPIPIEFNDRLEPIAQVYALGDIPDNFLARTSNPLSIPRGENLGSFAWDGYTINWGEGGPFGRSDAFLVEQTRVFYAPSAGTYSFTTTSDDGSWLWINGTLVVNNAGLHEADVMTGTIELSQGPHVLSFKYFERSGNATIGYAVKMPGQSGYGRVIDYLGGGSQQLASLFTESPRLYLAAADNGGTGVSKIEYWLNDETTRRQSTGQLLEVPITLPNGTHMLFYQAYDQAGNKSNTLAIRFTIKSDTKVQRIYMPYTPN